MSCRRCGCCSVLSFVGFPLHNALNPEQPLNICANFKSKLRNSPPSTSKKEAKTDWQRCYIWNCLTRNSTATATTFQKQINKSLRSTYKSLFNDCSNIYSNVNVRVYVYAIECTLICSRWSHISSLLFFKSKFYLTLASFFQLNSFIHSLSLSLNEFS